MGMAKDQEIFVAPEEVVTPPLPGQALVLFDGFCPFCRLSMNCIRRLDWFGALAWRSFRLPENVPPTTPPLDPVRLEEEMHLIGPTGSPILHGFGAFRYMAWRIPSLFPLAPLLYLPGVPWLGQKAYQYIAKNRFGMLPCKDGVCTIPPKSTK